MYFLGPSFFVRLVSITIATTCIHALFLVASQRMFLCARNGILLWMIRGDPPIEVCSFKLRRLFWFLLRKDQFHLPYIILSSRFVVGEWMRSFLGVHDLVTFFICFQIYSFTFSKIINCFKVIWFFFVSDLGHQLLLPVACSPKWHVVRRRHSWYFKKFRGCDT